MEILNGWKIIDQSTAIGDTPDKTDQVLVTVRWKDDTYNPVLDLEDMMDSGNTQATAHQIRAFGEWHGPAYYAMFQVSGQPTGTMSLKLGPRPTIQKLAQAESPQGLWDIFQTIVKQSHRTHTPEDQG